MGSMAVVMQAAASSPGALADSLRHAVTALDKDVPVSAVKPFDEIFADSVAPRRFSLLLLGGFAGAALLLAVLGIYGVISYTVTQRTRELGIRLALGASRGDVLRLVFRDGGRLIALGLALGGVSALVLTQFVSSLLFGVSAHDPLTFAAVAALLAGAALFACWLPARRATKVDPIIALRAE
jgi:putative ABC transport system permease protein